MEGHDTSALGIRVAGNLLLAWLLLACAPQAGAHELILAVARTPLALPLYVARDRGFFTDEGLEVSFREVSGGHRTLQMLFAGEAELATSSDTVLMYNSLERADFASLGYFVSSPTDLAIISRSPMPKMTREAWSGRRIGMVDSSSSEFLLHSWLLYHNLDAGTLQLVPVQPEQMLQALAEQRLDAVSVWQPYAFDILRKLPGSQALPNPGLHTLTFHLIARRGAIAARLQDYSALLRAIQRAEQFIAQHPSQAQAILRKELAVDQRFIDWIWPRYHYRLGLDQALITSLENQARWALSGRPAATPPNYLDFIDTRPLQQVAPGAVTVIE